MSEREYCVIKAENPETLELLKTIAEADEFLEREWARLRMEVFLATETRFRAEHGLA